MVPAIELRGLLRVERRRVSARIILSDRLTPSKRSVFFWDPWEIRWRSARSLHRSTLTIEESVSFLEALNALYRNADRHKEISQHVVTEQGFLSFPPSPQWLLEWVFRRFLLPRHPAWPVCPREVYLKIECSFKGQLDTANVDVEQDPSGSRCGTAGARGEGSWHCNWALYLQKGCPV